MANPQHPPCALCGSTAGPEHPCPGLYIGKTLDGRYQIESVLGMGGMGMVFQALQVSMKRPVALKTLHPNLAAAPQFFERFRREAETASKLVHPNIITIFDFGRAEDNTYFFVMELVEGESLKQLVKREGPMSLRRAFNILEQSANGLVLAHQMQVVHRDIKPHNILVSTVNRQDFVKILDFGLVKALEQTEDEQLTSTGQVLGTPQYMPPEQAGGEAVDARSDLYSLTGVLHFCLTGSSPFGANTVRKALQAAITQQVPSVASKRQGAPVGKAVEEFIRKGLAAEKADRHQSAEEFLDELRDAVSTLSDAELDALPFNDGGQIRESGSGSDSRRSKNTPSGSQKSRSGSRAGPASNVVVDRALDPNATISSGRRAGQAAEGAKRSKLPLVLGAAVVLVGAAAAVVVMKKPAETPAPTTQVISVDAPKPTASAQVAVSVTSQPVGADVFEGDVYRGKTPLELSLTRGAHPLVFKLDGHKDVIRNLDLASVAGEQFALDVDLQPVAKAQPTSTTKPKKKEEVPIFE